MALETGDYGGLDALTGVGLGSFEAPAIEPNVLPRPSGSFGMTADNGGVFDVPLSFGGTGFDTPAGTGAPAPVGSDISGGLSAPAQTTLTGAADEFGGSSKDGAPSGQTVTPTVKKDDGMSSMAKTALMAAPALGVAAWQIGKGPTTPASLGPLTDLASSQSAQSADMLAKYKSGEIPGGAGLLIQSNYRKRLSQINQYFAAAGARGGQDRFNSTDRLKQIEAAKTDMVVQYQQFLDSELKGALVASGQAGSFMAQAAQIQLQADQAFNKAIASAMEGIGKIMGYGVTAQQKAA